MKTIKTTVAITALFAVLNTTTLSLSVGLQAPVHAQDHGAHHDHSGHAHALQSNGQQSAANGGLFTQTQAQEYTCSMHPNFRSTDPNDRCPICGMELIPVAAGGSDDDDDVTRIEFSGRSLALLGLQTEPVRDGLAQYELRLTGQLDYDERGLTSISAWTSGRIERLFVNYEGARVAQGEPLIELYSPELLVAQQELLQALRLSNRQGPAFIQEGHQQTVRAARERLRLLGMTAAQIDALIARGEAQERVVIRAPSSGLVTTRAVSQGDYVNTGDMLLAIADSNKLWLVLDVFERDVSHFVVGDRVQLQLSLGHRSARDVSGTIVSLAPRIDDERRTRGVRIALDADDLVAAPGGFVRATLQLQREGVLTIPASAPLITGKRAVVYVQEEANSGAFAAREVELGGRYSDRYEVLSGLSAGELVVSRGAFRIDSELQLRGRPSMMAPQGGGATGHEHHGTNAESTDEHAEHAASDSAATHATTTTPVELDPSVDASAVFAAYHHMWAALHSDNLAAWQQAAAEFHDAVAAVTWPSTLATQHEQLATGAGHAHHVDRISVARDQFYAHSQAMIALAEAGYHQGDLHLMFCPMARRGEGAYWLQEDDALLNPYFGSRMLRCGDHMGVLSGGNH